MTVRSIDPVRSTPVTITVRDDRVDVSPEDALVCYGGDFDDIDVEQAGGNFAGWTKQEDHRVVEEAMCVHTNAFEDWESYREWSGGSESLTVSMDPREVVQVMRRVLSRMA